MKDANSSILQLPYFQIILFYLTWRFLLSGCSTQWGTCLPWEWRELRNIFFIWVEWHDDCSFYGWSKGLKCVKSLSLSVRAARCLYLCVSVFAFLCMYDSMCSHNMLLHPLRCVNFILHKRSYYIHLYPHQKLLTVIWGIICVGQCLIHNVLHAFDISVSVAFLSSTMPLI